MNAVTSISNFDALKKIKPNDWANIEILKIRGNMLERVIRFLPKCRKLKALTLYFGHQIKSIPKIIFELEQLRHLSLNSFNTSRLPDQLATMTNLTHLSIRYNKAIKELPDTISYLYNLKHLDVADNSISTFPDWLDELPELEFFNIRSNPCTRIPKNLQLPPKLQLLLTDKNTAKALEKNNLYQLKKIPCYYGTNLPRKVPKTQLSELDQLVNQPEGLNYDIPLKVLVFNILANFIEKAQQTATDKQLIQLLDLPKIGFIQRSALELLTKRKQQNIETLKTSAQIWVKGNIDGSKITLRKKLKTQDISYTTHPTQDTTHILLGHTPQFSADTVLNNTYTIITERILQDFLEKKAPPYLLQNTLESQQQLEKIQQLLWSNHPDNILLASTLLKEGGFPKKFLHELYVIFCNHPTSSAIKKEVRFFIKKHGSAYLLDTLEELHYWLNQQSSEQQLKNKIEQLSQRTELNGLTLANILYKIYKKGIAYLLEYLPQDHPQQVEILKALIQKETLSLERYNLSKFPIGICQLSQLKKLNLSGNAFKDIPPQIQTLKQLEFLYSDTFPIPIEQLRNWLPNCYCEIFK